MLQSDVGIIEYASHRIKTWWIKWWKISGVFYDKKVSNELKINSIGQLLDLRWCIVHNVGYKRTTHLKDDCSQNRDVALDL
jgi:hypothetical protein